MEKRFFCVLIACFLGTSLSVVHAELPFKLSTDTESGAVWYRVKNVRAAASGYDSYMQAVGDNERVKMASFIGTDDFYWCFVGAEAGFQIYNKAYAEDGGRLTIIPGGYTGYTPLLAFADTEWNYSWKCITAQGRYGLVSNFVNLLLHGLSGGSNMIVFYEQSPTASGSAWEFEEENEEIVVNFLLLNKYLEEYTDQVNADKAVASNVNKYGPGITTFQAAIAVAQAVADNPASTQSEVDAALSALRKASYQYHLAFTDLPFTKSPNAQNQLVWYNIINSNRQNNHGGSGFLTYTDEGKLVTTTPNNRDNQLWCFMGDNFGGMHIYNKANMANGAKLIYDDGFTISSDPWDGIWKVDFTTFYYEFPFWGLCNANGAYDQSYIINDFMHSTDAGDIIYYGLYVYHSLFSFLYKSTSAIPTSIQAVQDEAVSVYARDGKIYVQGSESKAALYSLTGGLLAVFDAGNPYSMDVKGIYIVQINGKAYKVIVQ